MQCDWHYIANFAMFMAYQLAIDSGNTSVKVYLAADGEIVGCHRFACLADADIDSLCPSGVDGCIVSTVRSDDAAAIEALKCRWPDTVVLSHTTPMPITIAYATPESLGRDRIAAAVGAYTPGSDHAAMVIDAGTALTLDVVDCNGRFMGGNISPGISMRLRALNHFTQRLPLVEAAGDTPMAGYDTITAIRSGVVNGIVAEIDGFISAVADKFGVLDVYLTGGDAIFLANRLKSSIFVDENLLAKGLIRILKYNR